MNPEDIQLPVLEFDNNKYKFIFLQCLSGDGEDFHLLVVEKETCDISASFTVQSCSEAEKEMEQLEQEFEIDSEKANKFLKKIKDFMRDPPDLHEQI